MTADYSLTFDSNPFISGVKRITQSLGGIEASSKNMTAKMTEAVSSGMSSMITKVGGLAAAYVGVRATMSKIPEIGKTFSIVGDIFSRNFLWPLRKELVPVLQNILNWTRDNRARFVEWGSVLVNVFRSLIQIGKAVIDAVKPIFKAFANIINDMLGTTGKSISETINILIFKITVLALFIAEMLGPVFQKVGEWIEDVYQIGKSWIMGFVGAISSDLMPTLEGLAQSLSEIFRMNEEGSITVEDLCGIYERLGNVIGSDVVVALESVVYLIDVAVTTLKILYYTLKGIVLLLAGQFKDSMKAFGEVGKVASGFGERTYRAGSRVEKTVRGAMSRDDEIVARRAALQPTAQSRTNNLQSSIRIDKIEITGTTPEDGKKAVDFVTKRANDNMNDDMRRLINGELATQGGS